MTGIILALDAMGGDKAPHIVFEGAKLAKERHPELSFLFYGQENALQPLLKKHKALLSCSEIRHAETIIPNTMQASKAVRNRKQSSMYMAINAVKNDEAHAVVSAGNTGALMAFSKLVLGTIPGIRRPAIASLFPTSIGESIMLDLGANIECGPETLSQFALMGQVFGKTVFGWDNPSVGLLNVGAENQKGKESIKEAATLIQESYPDIHYYGFIEGNDIPAGTVDVIVTDGFTGNVALKTAEGTASLIAQFVKESFKHSTLAKVGYVFAKPAIEKLKNRLDPRHYNGAVFLGLNKVSIKSHGGTDPMGFAAAIDVAVDMIKQDCINTMAAGFAKKADEAAA